MKSLILTILLALGMTAGAATMQPVDQAQPDAPAADVAGDDAAAE